MPATTTRRSAAVVALAVVLLAGSATAVGAACASVGALPATISAPGTYCLAGDLAHGGEGAAVRIAASDVVLDLGGFTLAGGAGPGRVTTGIEAVGVDRVTVRNGVVTGFRQGVMISGGSGHRVETVQARQNWYFGLIVYGTSSAIRDCQVTKTGGSTFPGDTKVMGIRVSAGDVVVADNVVEQTLPPPGGEAVGILLIEGEGSGARIERNVIANAAVGPDLTIGIWTQTPEFELRNNLIIRYGTGMGLAPPSVGVYADNVFFNVPTPVSFGRSGPRDGGGNSVARAFCEPIYSLPYLISRQGTYCLVRNLGTAIATGQAILIAAGDVTLDLRGFELDGSAAGPGSEAFGVHAVDRRNVTVRNGNIRGFGRAVSLEDSSNDLSIAAGYRVEGILADASTLFGIDVQGRASIVRHNRVLETAGTSGGTNAPRVGIRIQGANGRVLDNEISGTGGASQPGIGIEVRFGRGVIAERNRISGAVGDGLSFESTVDAAAIGNRIVGTGRGIWFAGSSGVYRGNLTAGVTNPYIGGTDAGGNN
jgi:hypothetical protein